MARVLRSVAVVAGVAALVVFAAALVMVATVDVDDHRDLLISELERRTGRTVRIDGGLSIDGWLTPTLVASGVRIGNPAWSTRPDMLVVERIEARVALAPLAFGRAEIRRVALVGPQIALETAFDGRRSWVFGAGDVDGAPASSDLPTFDLRALEIRDLGLTHLNVASGLVRELTIPTLALAVVDDALLSVSLGARYAGVPVEVSGRIGRAPTLFSGRPYPLELAADAAGLHVEVAGVVERMLEDPEFSGSASFKADDLAGARARLRGVSAEAGASGVRISASGASVQTLDLRVGDSHGAGRIAVVWGSGRPSLEADLVFEHLNLEQLLRGEPGSAEPAPARNRVFPDDPLDLTALRVLDARVALRATSLRSAGADFDGVDAHAVLAGGDLRIEPIEAGYAGARASGKVRIDASGNETRVEAVLDASGVEAARVLPPGPQGPWVEGPADVAVDVRGHGSSVAALMGSLSGEARLLMSGGRVRARSAEMMIGGVSALAKDMTAGSTPWSTLGCAAADFQIESGLATARVLVVDTEHATVTGEGGADLGRETLAMTLTPAPKSMTLNLAVPVHVSGTFLDPSFRPDEAATARRVGSAALMVFPPAALASLGVLAVYGAGAAGAAGADAGGAAHPCLALAGGAGSAPAEPSRTRQVTESVKEGFGRAADKIKGLFGN